MSTAVDRRELTPGSKVEEVGEWKRLATLSWTLALTDWKLRFYGSVLGLAWTLVRPFALFGVIYFVFTEIAGLDKNVHNYGLYILFALVLFTFFSEMTATAVQALVLRESLLRKMQFNPIAIPLAITITATLNLGTTLIGVLVFCLGSGLYPLLTWLELPVIVLLLAMFGTGVGMLLSVAFVRFRDVQPIWDVIAQILFYASAILYVAVPTVPSEYLQVFLCNPLAALFTQMRHAMVDNGAPSLASAFNHDYYVLIPLTIIVGTFILGMVVFQRESPRIAEHL
ncbi:MAG: transporter permease [Conexibacter sp.]|nr:transporter permease [Conexibacter sp.]